jgi:hypothetical protein
MAASLYAVKAVVVADMSTAALVCLIPIFNCLASAGTCEAVVWVAFADCTSPVWHSLLCLPRCADPLGGSDVANWLLLLLLLL